MSPEQIVFALILVLGVIVYVRVRVVERDVVQHLYDRWN